MKLKFSNEDVVLKSPSQHVVLDIGKTCDLNCRGCYDIYCIYLQHLDIFLKAKTWKDEPLCSSLSCLTLSWAQDVIVCSLSMAMATSQHTLFNSIPSSCSYFVFNSTTIFKWHKGMNALWCWFKESRSTHGCFLGEVMEKRSKRCKGTVSHLKISEKMRWRLFKLRWRIRKS